MKKRFRKTLVTLLPLASFLVLAPATQAADLKQLAEQLVNKQQGPSSSPRGMHGIREGGRTVGAGQRMHAPGSGQGSNRLIIEKEGANVKKEKGVEDVE